MKQITKTDAISVRYNTVSHTQILLKPYLLIYCEKNCSEDVNMFIHKKIPIEFTIAKQHLCMIFLLNFGYILKKALLLKYCTKNFPSICSLLLPRLLCSLKLYINM